MNIGLVIEDYPPFAVGGAAYSARELARSLVAAGHKVIVVTPNYGALAREVEEGVLIYRYPFPQRLRLGEVARGLFLLNPLHYLCQALVLIRLIRREGLEVLHAQNAYSAVGAFLAGRLSGIKVFQTLRDARTLCTAGQACALPGEVISSRCSPWNYLRCLSAFRERNYPSLKGWGRWKFTLDGVYRGLDLLLRRFCLRRMDGVIFVSEGLRRIYLDHGFSDLAPRTATVYNLAPSPGPRVAAREDLRASLGIPDGRPLVVYAGKLSFGKGTHILLQAIPRVVERVSEALFVLVGPPNPSIPLPDPSRERPCLLKLPPLPHPRVLDLFSISSVVISPSTTWPEPLSRILLEAMSLSKPVVGTRVGGTSEAIEDGVTGFLVEPADPKGLGDRIADLLEDPDRAGEMGRAGRALLEERFSPERILPRLLSVYRGDIPCGGNLPTA